MPTKSCYSYLCLYAYKISLTQNSAEPILQRCQKQRGFLRPLIFFVGRFYLSFTVNLIMTNGTKRF
jgi:hypothetical protein